MPSNWWVILIGVLGGAAVGIQGVIAAAMGQRVGGTASSFIIHLSGLLMSGALLWLQGGQQIRAWPRLPWYMLGAGVFGVILYLTISVTMPRLGATMMITLIIIGQLTAGVLVDQFGWLGAPVHPLDAGRVVGLLILLAGGYLISRAEPGPETQYHFLEIDPSQKPGIIYPAAVAAASKQPGDRMEHAMLSPSRRSRTAPSVIVTVLLVATVSGGCAYPNIRLPHLPPRPTPEVTAALTEDVQALAEELATADAAESAQADALVATPEPILPPTPNGAVEPEPPVPAQLAVPLATPQSLDRTENILVLGTDSRPGDTVWRTDSIMIIVIDRQARQVGIVSIPRDLYVNIPGYGKERINAADYIGERTRRPRGGPGLVGEVLQDTLGIPTQHYIRLQQDGLVNLVDALGGVTVTLDCPLYEMTPTGGAKGKYARFSLPAGPVFLDGASAKKFATFRYVTSNFNRQRRQQQLIWAIRDRTLRGDVLPRVPQLLQALGGAVATDLQLSDILSLANLGIGLRAQDVHALSLGPEFFRDYTTAKGAMVLVVRDPKVMKAATAAIFSSKPLSEAGKPAASGCPRPPRGFPDLTPKPAPAE